jgi:lysophospholipase L1-like esterase
MAVACGVLPFLLLEGGLRLFGVGHDLRLVVPASDAPGAFQLNPRFDEAFYGAVDLSGPEARPFQIPKPQGAFRIVVVGGSTVIGFPYAADLAFPRQLEVLLQRSARDGTTFEVLNAGMTALNSSSEVTVVEESLIAQPDLLIVYTGHNEFYGPNGAAAPHHLEPKWFRRLAHCRRWRLLQLGRRIASPSGAAESSPNLIERFAADVHIAETSDVFRNAAKQFRENLEQMVASARRRAIPIVLVAPACNERHQPPIEPGIAARKQPDEPAWHEKLRQAERALRLDRLDQARELLETIQAESANSAHWHFRWAQVHDRLGNIDVAARHYRRARDLDGGRFRAPSAFTEIVRDVAERHGENGVEFVDVQAALERDDSAGILGRSHFLEHVHFTWDGNASVARALARFLAEKKRVPVVDAPDFDSIDVAGFLNVQPEEHLAARLLAVMVYQTPPFGEGTDASLIAKRMAAEVIAEVDRLPRERRANFDELSTREMSIDPARALLERAKAADRQGEARRWLTILSRRRPWEFPLPPDEQPESSIL